MSVIFLSVAVVLTVGFTDAKDVEAVMVSRQSITIKTYEIDFMAFLSLDEVV
jgi:hypothetical protein